MQWLHTAAKDGRQSATQPKTQTQHKLVCVAQCSVRRPRTAQDQIVKSDECDRLVFRCVFSHSRNRFEKAPRLCAGLSSGRRPASAKCRCVGSGEHDLCSIPQTLLLLPSTTLPSLSSLRYTAPTSSYSVPENETRPIPNALLLFSFAPRYAFINSRHRFYAVYLRNCYALTNI